MTDLEILEYYRDWERQNITEHTTDWDHQVPAKGSEDVVRLAWARLDKLEDMMMDQARATLRVPHGASLRIAVDEPGVEA